MVDTLTGFALGALIGAISTAFGSYFVYWRRERATTRRLRQAFVHEIQSMSYIDELADGGEYERLTKSIERPVIYESNADKIGYLSDEEVGALVDFYADVYWLDEQEDIEDKKDAVADVVAEREALLELLSSNSSR